MLTATVKTGARRALSNSRRTFSSTVYAWGTGDEGQLGLGEVSPSVLTGQYVEASPCVVEALENQDVVHASCGLVHSAVATEDGRVLTWGKQGPFLGHNAGDGGKCLSPTVVEGDIKGVKVASVSCGGGVTTALSKDGDLFSWGSGNTMMRGYNTLGLATKEDQPVPKQVLFGGTDEIKITKINHGKNHALALGEDGEIWTWGRGKDGVLGLGGATDALEPFPVDFFLDIDATCVDIACGEAFSLALTDEGKVFAWGKNDRCQLGLGGGLSLDHYAAENLPQLVEGPLKDEKVVALGAGGSQALALTESGDVYFWGNKLWMEPHKMTALAEHHIVKVDCGSGYSAALSDAGQLFTWSRGGRTRFSGVLGHGTSGRFAQPELVKALKNVPLKSIACGSRHVIAITGMP
mmetsp:Transcript_24044/g.42424  ORF Transcript_24044/g.42424 Transcript_24044/m.42424 type:complete len:407 (+) Transcript_24044:270-1490(+)